jgi:hypothetical protein
MMWHFALYAFVQKRRKEQSIYSWRMEKLDKILICIHTLYVLQKSDWSKIRAVLVLESFDFVFSAHLMVTILEYINEFSMCL